MKRIATVVTVLFFFSFQVWATVPQSTPNTSLRSIQFDTPGTFTASLTLPNSGIDVEEIVSFENKSISTIWKTGAKTLSIGIDFLPGEATRFSLEFEGKSSVVTMTPTKNSPPAISIDPIEVNRFTSIWFDIMNSEFGDAFSQISSDEDSMLNQGLINAITSQMCPKTKSNPHNKIELLRALFEDCGDGNVINDGGGSIVALIIIGAVIVAASGCIGCTIGCAMRCVCC